MKKIKTADATPEQLNWLVAQIEGDDTCKPRDYCGDWSFGGPIIDREGITPSKARNRAMCVAWLGCASDFGLVKFYTGPTTLIAAMRCRVASKLGDEVEIPEELA